MKRRRSSITTAMFHNNTSSADDVVAATAGEDSWKTWAGRSHGTSEFEWMDLIRGSRREVLKLVGVGKSNLPTACPVCYNEDVEEWHVTESCFHAVCVDCLRGYASSQVLDATHSGPLKCPICPQVLRKKDALVALQGSPDLIKSWDEKIRNQLLRALPSYRPCPHCSTTSSTTADVDAMSLNEGGTGGGAGGGFVTPSCLAPHYQERREEATKLLHQGLVVAVVGVALAWMLWCWQISKWPSSSPIVDLVFMLLPLAALVPNFRLVRRYFAKQARQALFRPISVECPGCLEGFLLPASSNTIADAESKQWMERNTRPCPSCSVPISKQGGCNHMKCPNCHAGFCWACMQLQTTCRAYSCQNGARFGNAIPTNHLTEAVVNNVSLEDTLLNRIDAILNPTSNTTRTREGSLTRKLQAYSPYWQNGLVVFLGLFGRSSKLVQAVVEPMVQLIAAISATTSWWILIFVVMWNMGQWYQHLQERQRRRQRHARQHWDHAQGTAGVAPATIGIPVTASEFWLGAQERNRRDWERNNYNIRRRGRVQDDEDAALREALRRSVLEQ